MVAGAAIVVIIHPAVIGPTVISQMANPEADDGGLARRTLSGVNPHTPAPPRWAASAVMLATAALLVAVDLLSGGGFLVLGGLAATAASLSRQHLVPRMLAAAGLSAVTTAAMVVTGSGASTFGVAEAAALALLLGKAVRRLPFPATAYAAVPLAGVILALPRRLSSDVGLVTIYLGLCVAAVLALAGYQRARDAARARAIDRVRGDERLALARDLHDSVAHHVTGIVVLAQAARLVARHRPDEAVEALAAIEREGAESLASMRRLVDVLRRPEATRQPPGGLAQVEVLVTRFRGGPTAKLDVAPEVADLVLPAAVGASVHRVVQEALTNVRRHAPDAEEILVRVERSGSGLRVVVIDDGGRRPAGRGRSDGGYGLVGLAERLAALGGRFSAGPRGTGGWEVQAEFPLDPASSNGGEQ